MASDIRGGGASPGALLGPHDPPPVRIINPNGASSFLLIGDHAGNVVPEALDGLGVPPEELARHIGWDIGIGELGALLSEALDAVFIRQTYSRLVIDCNREPGRIDAMPEVSDLTVIPGNRGLAPEARAARVAAIQAPYQDAIAAEIARRDAAGQRTILVSLHSFTPAMQGVQRPWEVGMLYDRHPAFSQALIEAFRSGGDLTVGDNEPYRMDIIDYTVPRHAYPAARHYAEIEVRQDLIATTDGCVEWSARLAAALEQTAASLTAQPSSRLSRDAASSAAKQ